MIINHNKKLLHIAIPRTGSSSLTYLMHTGPLPEPDIHHMPISTALEMHPQAKNYFKFTIVRHPLDKLLSTYLEFTVNRKGQYSATIVLDKPLLSEFNDFQDFCLRLKNSIWLHNVFFKPQYWFTHINDVNVMNYCGRFEKLMTEFQYLRRYIGYAKPRVQHFRPTQHTAFVNYYTQETTDAIYNIYKKDFEAFNYDI